MLVPKLTTTSYLLAIRSVRIPSPSLPSRVYVILSPTNPRERIRRKKITNKLLTTSTAAPAETQHHNNIKPAPEYGYPHYPIITAIPTQSSSSPQTLPGSCYTTWDDWEHTTATVKTYECYTRTSLIPPASCPTLSCAPRPTDQVCPLYIRVSSITVPCATDCCPTTSTVYRESIAATTTTTTTGAAASTTLPCPTCEACPIPTEWITYTTGCAGTPTITEVNAVTPSSWLVGWG
ncbi:hypothetical protein F4680DRAFT_297582 [Xylaria scruposa]|nr:hypothetical protein F4680DRAFT_297582 [Xylaria scruposa]